jgi:GDP-mannose 6-dehydrogenase
VTAGLGRAIRKKGRPHTVVIRSTVVPGTTRSRLAPALAEHSGRPIGDGVELCFQPEFLREGSAGRDFYEPPFTLGGSVAGGGIDQLREIYADIHAPFIDAPIDVAESVKFVSNGFHALKIAFANEVGSVLKAGGIDSRQVMDLFCQDRSLNISPAYLRPGFAFGGSCLPKELHAFQAMAQSFGIETPMLGRVLDSNAKHVARCVDQILRHSPSHVALFGLAFKRGTDDLRSSPFVTLADALLARGVALSIYDEGLELGRLIGANRDYIDREIPHLEQLLKHEPGACLKGASLIVVGHAGADVIGEIAAHHAGRPIIDLNHVKKLAELPGATYEGSCW